MSPKAKSSKVITHRIELQSKERKALEDLVTQTQILTASQTIENATDAFSNLTKPFFGSGDEGLLLTFITASLLDELIVPDDSLIQYALDTETGEFVFRSIFSFLQVPSAIQSMYWWELTQKQKEQAKPILMALSKALKTTKYLTGSYLAAKVGADLLEAVIPL
jgi:hypothetical protein